MAHEREPELPELRENAVSSHSRVVSPSADPAAEEAIRAKLKIYEQAIKAADAEKILSLFSPGVAVFDLMTPFKYEGKDRLRDRLLQWFGGYQKGVDYKFNDFTVTAGDSVAVAYGLIQSTGVLKDGKTSSMWLRSTLMFQNIAGDWLITHEHSSEPFDMKTMKAVLQKDEVH